MTNTIRGLNRIWTVIACAYFIFAIVYSPRKIIREHSRAASEAESARADRNRAIEGAEKYALWDLKAARDDLQSKNGRLDGEEKHLESTNAKLSDLQKELVEFDRNQAAIDRLEKQTAAIYKQLNDDLVKEESSQIDNHVAAPVGDKVIEQLRAAADAKVEALRKQLPPESESRTFDREYIQRLIRLNESYLQDARTAVEEAKVKVQFAVANASVAEKEVKTKSWFPDLKGFDAQIDSYGSESKWSSRDLLRIIADVVIPIVLFWIAYRLLSLVVLWIAKGFKS